METMTCFHQNMKHPRCRIALVAMLLAGGIALTEAQTIQSRLPDETELHEGTWLTWPHSYTYGAAYRNSLDATWVAMTKALVAGERVPTMRRSRLGLPVC